MRDEAEPLEGLVEIDIELLRLVEARVAELLTQAAELGLPEAITRDTLGLQRTLQRATGALNADRVSQLFRVVLRVTQAQTAEALKGPSPSRPPYRVRVGDVELGDGTPQLIAGPCAVEGRGQLLAVAQQVAKLGGRFLRGGAYKPRTSPYSFQGLGEDGLDVLAEVARETGLLVVTEVLDPRDVERVAARAAVLQIGTRNMYNQPLLKACGQAGRPVLLKRGFMATLDELKLAAEYIQAAGNPDVILCERGIRTFEGATRNTLDVSAIPLLKAETGLPVVADVSHAAGRSDLAVPLARAALAAGADGIMVEAHPHPHKALSDHGQQLSLSELASFVEQTLGWISRLR